ncbi:cytochrome P450 [Phascolomyces articulosus]|uniref:Cytochrome P450 n=1 Tax=Phascolomyces articulosus TaxID=60185 RepID=A0AAD5KBE5_9FUNG|nr:cytochrome P450 [Phascolomyces articulosus]
MTALANLTRSLSPSSIAPFINKLMENYKTRRPMYISVILFFGIYLIFNKITRVPARLRHIPQAKFFPYLKSIISFESYDETASKITLPASKKSKEGLYVVFDAYGWTVHVTRPEAAKKVLFKTDLFPKISTGDRRETLFGRFAMGPSLPFLNGPQWKAQRKVANPAFHRSMPINLFGELTQKLFNQYDKMLDKPIPFHELMIRWTLDAIGIAGFDFDFNAIDDPTSVWVVRYNTIMKAFSNPLFVVFPSLETRWISLFPKQKQAHVELTAFLNNIQEIIKKKRETLANEELSGATTKKQNDRDLLTLMLEASAEGNGTLTDEELQYNLCAFFTGGHDTTSNQLSFAAYNLAANPEIQEKAREEAIRLLGDEPKDIIPSADQLREMPYINMFIKENLRHNGTATMVFARKTEEDTDLEGVFIPKDTPVVVDLYEIHHNESIWTNPFKFDPERFVPGGEADQLAKMGSTWLPFGNGQRICIGMNFSLAEQRVFLPMLLRKYELSLPENSIHKDKVVMNGYGVVSPKDLQITLKRRY